MPIINRLSQSSKPELLDDVDRKLLDIVQDNFPLHPRPYRILAAQAGIGEDEALARINRMRDSGLIRRLGANFQSRKLGFVSTLCAAKVPPGQLEAFIARVNLEPGVTHNYLREHAYNVWFTLIAPSAAEKAEILKTIANDTGLEILDLPATRLYKIKVDFPMREDDD